MGMWGVSVDDTSGDVAIEAEGVVKRFGKVEALSGLDMTARRGQITALLGPNGVGKTTLVRAIATLLRPDTGTLRIHGVDVVRQPEAVRRIIGLAGQLVAVEPALTGRENIHMVARLYGVVLSLAWAMGLVAIFAPLTAIGYSRSP